jgi:hypothetical protein
MDKSSRFNLSTLERVRVRCSAAFLVVVVLFTAIFMTGGLIERSRGYIGGIIVHDNSNPAYLNLTSESHVVLVGASSLESNPVRQQARSVGHLTSDPVAPYGMFERVDHKILFVQGDPALARIVLELNDRWSRMSAPRFQWLAVLIAFALGLALWTPARRYGPAILACLCAISTALYLHRCATCPNPDLLFGVDIALLGALFFGAATIVSLLLKDAARDTLITGALLVSGASQCVLFFHASESCPMCISIFILTGIYMGSSMRVEQTQPARLRFVLASSALCPLLLFSLLSMQPASASAKSNPRPLSHHETDVQLVGRSLDSLGIKRTIGSSPINGPCLILIGSSTCQSCHWALRWAASQTLVPLFKVSNFTEGSGGSLESPYWLDAGRSAIANPTLLVVDTHNTIVDEECGWAESEIFKKALEERFATALAVANERHKEIHK